MGRTVYAAQCINSCVELKASISVVSCILWLRSHGHTHMCCILNSDTMSKMTNQLKCGEKPCAHFFNGEKLLCDCFSAWAGHANLLISGQQVMLVAGCTRWYMLPGCVPHSLSGADRIWLSICVWVLRYCTFCQGSCVVLRLCLHLAAGEETPVDLLVGSEVTPRGLHTAKTECR